MDLERAALSVGALLYTPASSATVASHILGGDWPCLTSVSLCLEDSIGDAALPEAELQLRRTLQTLKESGQALPMLFVRVRTPEHLGHLHEFLGSVEEVLTGYIFPKFDLSNAGAFLNKLSEINGEREKKLFAMPILESRAIASVFSRSGELKALRDLTDAHREAILNIRVGGNDFCNLYGLRRKISETIYDLGIVRDILTDILNVFSDDYVVSGPVWEYYGSDAAVRGLRRETALDRANGFMGKTAIHPSQLKTIRESLMVSRVDFEDAMRILNWHDADKGVAGSADGGRMNEVKTHGRWARRVMLRAEIYGILEEDPEDFGDH